MARINPDRVAILERRRNVAHRYVRGQTQWEIARAFEVDQGTISRDLAAIQEEWKAAALMDLDSRKAKELATVDEVERQAWVAWTKSQENAETLKARRSGDKEFAEKVTKGQAGNPKFLNVVLDCVRRRCEILGILKVDAPSQMTVVTVVGGIDLAVITGDKPGLPAGSLHYNGPDASPDRTP